MKNPVSIKIIFMGFGLLAGILFSSVAFATASKIVLFCSSWSMQCREARTACFSLAQETGINFTDLDIDQKSSLQKANNLGLSFPSAIPYLYIIDKKGNVIKGKLYNGEALQELKQEIIKYT
ncbi:MAG: hypothetical protein WCG23_00585 [bacterium]